MSNPSENILGSHDTLHNEGSACFGQCEIETQLKEHGEDKVDSEIRNEKLEKQLRKLRDYLIQKLSFYFEEKENGINLDDVKKEAKEIGVSYIDLPINEVKKTWEGSKAFRQETLQKIGELVMEKESRNKKILIIIKDLDQLFKDIDDENLKEDLKSTIRALSHGQNSFCSVNAKESLMGETIFNEFWPIN